VGPERGPARGEADEHHGARPLPGASRRLVLERPLLRSSFRRGISGTPPGSAGLSGPRSPLPRGANVTRESPLTLSGVRAVKVLPVLQEELAVYRPENADLRAFVFATSTGGRQRLRALVNGEDWAEQPAPAATDRHPCAFVGRGVERLMPPTPVNSGSEGA
jgi:hypothetical protein